MTRKELSIRDCILILMMDNLVRLKYHNDQDPGESRSMQICTLLITVKGMPEDALIVENGIWNTLAVQTVENPDTTLETSLASLKVDDEDDTLSLNADEMGNYLDHLNEMETEYFDDASLQKCLLINEEEETFEQIFESRNVNVDDLEQESNIDLNHSNMSLDDSFNFTSLNFEEDDECQTEGILNTLHFTMFQPPPLLARHPPPATGKDDDTYFKVE
ncbi:unnamed protein product [Mytilus coruscus]|uniref:Uncharacterized protein n=1 Tax=Mytilus coruscus TaxID=42192 RepID=A0A6J8ARF8_MYTCO|nr:unnamed protein product [Mytilus coruscus]